MVKSPIICALDTPEVASASILARELGPHVGAVKLGLEFFCAHGAGGVQAISSGGVPIFLDLKLHDIPNTVAGAIRSLQGLKVAMTTVHTMGGAEMLRAAVNANESGALLLGVTILTSMDQANLASIGVESDVESQVLRLAELAATSGLGGVVCSPKEITAIKQRFGDDLTLVVPGIRPVGSDVGDQKRVMTPKDALEQGADYLVIGRPITQADDPVAAAQAINASL